MVVNSKGRACTQRVDPKLALVEVQLPPDALAEDFQPTNNSYMGNLFTTCDDFLVIYFKYRWIDMPVAPMFSFTKKNKKSIL